MPSRDMMMNVTIHKSDLQLECSMRNTTNIDSADTYTVRARVWTRMRLGGSDRG